jgi:hypothetical protein
VTETSGRLTTEAVDVVFEIYAMVHDRLDALLAALPSDALDWRPTDDCNSAAVLLTHTLAAEREVLSVVTGERTTRSRSDEFDARGLSPQELREDLYTTRRQFELARTLLTTEHLLRRTARRDTPQSGLRWLVWNAGHSREHLGQLELLRDLCPK